MLVSWNWLQDYVQLDMSPEELAHRLAMAGLNHEATRELPGDVVIDLEITSNRPDCLGHLGVAREISVLWNRPLTIPAAAPTESNSMSAAALTRVALECPALCPRYTARVLRGVRIGASPAWLVERLQAVGIATINNIVDITNYVMLECGQPLHAFDFAQLRGRRIVVREARAGEKFQALDHREYTLESGMCVIADADRAVALGGVMGGADSEISPATQDVLLESAEFAPLAIRTTARKLGLHSPSSYRFERGVDPEGVERASRRCCQLIVELAGGQLAQGVVDVGRSAPERPPIVLRLAQLPRVLGISIERAEVARILRALGNELLQETAESLSVRAPSYRRDLSREIDLIEEVARIHGYDQIPENVAVPMTPSHRSVHDRVQDRVRRIMTSAGFHEAMTVSVVSSEWSEAFSPWTDAAPLISSTPLLKGADRLRRSLIPSLLDARRINQSIGNPTIELFETAHLYLPRPTGLPMEQWTLGLTSGGDYLQVKGIVEALVAATHRDRALQVRPTRQPLLDPERASELFLGEEHFGFLGEVSAAGRKQFGLRGPTTIAELNLDAIVSTARLVPQHRPLSLFPGMTRDLNLVVGERVRWSDLASTVRTAAGPHLEELEFREIYRDPQKDGAGQKRFIFTMRFRAADRTLTGEEVDAARDEVVAACGRAHHAVLLG